MILFRVHGSPHGPVRCWSDPQNGDTHGEKGTKNAQKDKKVVQRIRDRTSKAGRAPGSLESSPGATGTVLIRIADYDARAFNETTAQSIEECRQYTKTPTVTWINVEGPSSPAELEVVRQSFGVHPLVLEDIATTSQRPKVEVFDDYIFIVVRMFRYDDPAATVREEQVSIIFGKNYVLTFSEGLNEAFES